MAQGVMTKSLDDLQITDRVSGMEPILGTQEPEFPNSNISEWSMVGRFCQNRVGV